MLDGSGKLKTDSFYFISDDNTHDTNFMYKIIISSYSLNH